MGFEFLTGEQWLHLDPKGFMSRCLKETAMRHWMKNPFPCGGRCLTRWDDGGGGRANLYLRKDKNWWGRWAD